MNFAMVDEYLAGRIYEHSRIEQDVARAFDDPAADKNAVRPRGPPQTRARFAVGNFIRESSRRRMRPPQRHRFGQNDHLSTGAGRLGDPRFCSREIGLFLSRLNEHLGKRNFHWADESMIG
jgi:hypothetical protein